MFILTEVTNWSDKRDSAYRVAPIDGAHRDFVLNINRFSDIIVDPNDVNKSQFKFFDNYRDRRESWSYIKSNTSVAEIIATHDIPLHSNMITLNIHRWNNPLKETVATTLPLECIAYLDKYNQDDIHCWLVYYNAAFKRREVLADITLDTFIDIVETGTTSTTSTTTERGGGEQ